MWWVWATAALAYGPPVPEPVSVDAPVAMVEAPPEASEPRERRHARRRAESPEEPLDVGRLQETRGDVPLLTDLPTAGRLGPVRLRVGRQKAPFLHSYLEDLRSVPLVQRPLSTGAMAADRLVGGRAQVRQGPIGLTVAGGHPENLRGNAWDLQARTELHVGPVHLGVGASRGHHLKFAPRVEVVDRFRWYEAEPRDVGVRRTAADVAWNPRPVRLDLEAATLRAKGPRAAKGRRQTRMYSGAAGASVMLTGEKRPVDSRIQPAHPWDPEHRHLGALELGARFERLYVRTEEMVQIDQVSTGLTAHPLPTVRLPLVYSRAWSATRAEDRLMLRVQVDR